MPPYGRFWFSITIVIEGRAAMNESIARKRWEGVVERGGIHDDSRWIVADRAAV